MILIGAGCSASVESPGKNEFPLNVLTTVPTNGMTDVSVDVVIMATFSHQLVPSTVTTATFFLRDGQIDIPGTVTCSGKQATFTPANPIPYGTLCTATITAEVRGTDALSMVWDYIWSFTTEAAPIVRNWGTPQRIEMHSGHGRYPEIAMDGLGNAIVVWDEDDSGIHNVWANHYEAGQGWVGAQKIVDNAGPIQYPHVAANVTGTAVAVGPYHDGLTDYRLWTRRYEPGTGWENVEMIGPDTIRHWIQHPRVAIHPGGNAMAVWGIAEGANLRQSLLASRYKVGIGWELPIKIESDDTGHALYPQVRMYATGGALAVWQQFNGTDYEVLSNRYLADAGWLGTVRVSAAGVDAKSPNLDMDAAGTAHAVWEQSGVQDVGIWASRHTISAGWSAPVRIEAMSGLGDIPAIAVDAVGNACAVWKQNFMAQLQSIAANHYDSITGWETATVIDQQQGLSQNPFIAVGAGGDAIAVYNRTSIFAVHYTDGLGWGLPVEIAAPGLAEHAIAPRIAIDGNGNAIAVWYQLDGTNSTYHIWANIYR